MSAARQTSATAVPAARLRPEQEPFLAVRSLATNYASGYRIELHQHSWHQLLFASSGAMTVSVPKASWMVPTGSAVFIPGRSFHAIRMWGSVEMRTLYFSPPLTSFQDKECRVVEVSSLLRELILRSVELAALDSRSTPDNWIIRLLEDEIRAVSMAAGDSPLMLPLPADERALALARHVLEQPLATKMVGALAQDYGLARRTLERRFRDETGMSFGCGVRKPVCSIRSGCSPKASQSPMLRSTADI